MFTGIIEEVGTVRRIERGAKGARLTIGAKTVLEDTKIGDSIATNGVCLTVVSKTCDSFSADVMAESLRRSALGSLQSGSPGFLPSRMVCAPVCGMMETEKSGSVTAATVRLTPSIAIEPFSTM